ncbi:MAG: hypothetical protein LBR86_04650 [Tannerella sp.]|jgi:hypothetical protein|nr:hypothetical protein [Tannerella sp.]
MSRISVGKTCLKSLIFRKFPRLRRGLAEDKGFLFASLDDIGIQGAGQGWRWRRPVLRALPCIFHSILHDPYLEMLKIQEDTWYDKFKSEEFEKEMRLKKEGKPVAAPMYDFYTSPMEYTFELLYRNKLVKFSLEEAISKIETVL